MRWRRAMPFVPVAFGALVGTVTVVLRESDWDRRIWVAAAGAVIALTGIIIAVLIAATGRHPAPNRCQACGYNLTGNISGVCPECGETV